MFDNDEEVQQEIRDEYAEQFAACRDLASFVLDMFKSWAGRGIEHTHEGMIVALLARSLDTFICSVDLAERGYTAQAMMLNRSLYEDMADAHWIATDSKTAVQRYEDHHEHNRMLLAEQMAKYPRHVPDLALPNFDPEERKRLDGIFGPHGTAPWSKLSIYDRVELIAPMWKHEVAREDLRFFRDIAQRQNNQTLHVSASSLNATVEHVDDDWIRYRMGPRHDGWLAVALFGAFWTFTQTITLVIDEMEWPMSDNERARLFGFRAFITLTDEQMKTTGRNDPCPCGCGLKFKRCHGR